MILPRSGSPHSVPKRTIKCTTLNVALSKKPCAFKLWFKLITEVKHHLANVSERTLHKANAANQ